MKYTIITLLIIASFSKNSTAQTIAEVDSMSYQLCEYFETLKDIENDTIMLITFYQKGFNSAMAEVSKDKEEKISQQLYYRLQRNCVEFRNLLDRLEPPKETVIRKTEKPETKMSKSEINEFKKINSFMYFEVNGDTTKVEMSNNSWVDNFADFTYSKLSYEWIGDS